MSDDPIETTIETTIKTIKWHMWATWAATAVLWVVAVWPIAAMAWWKYLVCALPAIAFTVLSVNEYMDYRAALIKAVIKRMEGK